LLLGKNNGCITTNPNLSVLQCNGNIPLHFQPKCLRLRHQLGRWCCVFRFLWSTVSPFSEFCIVLWSSVEASGCNSQKTSRPTGKRSTASSWPCQSPYSPSNPGEDSWTPVGTFYSPDLAPSDFHLFSPLKHHLGGKRFADDEEVETEMGKWMRQQSKDFYAAGFDALVKRWGKCINVSEGYVEKCFFQVRISHVICFISICDLFTESPS
jgi:hypothetical protein